MIWSIPAKTFLLGEYLALSGNPAMLLCTRPVFKLSVSAMNDASIHTDAPASRYWQQVRQSADFLNFSDPYAGSGGFGASSAQFLGAYLEQTQQQGQLPCFTGLINAYNRISKSDSGTRPSGYDLMAQASSACVYIHKNNQELVSFSWPFKDLSFALFHTGHKLATHVHLKAFSPIGALCDLIALVDLARDAFESADAMCLVKAINAYHEALLKCNLVAAHSVIFVSQLMQFPGVLAAKGCGALGADVILMFTHPSDLSELCNKAQALGLQKIATDADLYQDLALIQRF